MSNNRLVTLKTEAEFRLNEQFDHIVDSIVRNVAKRLTREVINQIVCDIEHNGNTNNRALNTVHK